MSPIRVSAGAAACLWLAVSSAFGETRRPWPETLSVDFLNREQQSLSVAVGALDGVTADMDFAVVDSNGRQIAQFFPDEIRPERFWSGPLPVESFRNVAVGQSVLRIQLAADKAARARREGTRLKASLDLARHRETLRRLREDLAETDERINDLRVVGVRLARNRISLEQDLAEQRVSVEPRVAEYDARINAIMKEWNEKDGSRAALLERKDAILRRSSPSQSDLDRVNREIGDLDRKLGQLQEKMRDYWNQKQALLDSIGNRNAQRLQESLAEEADNQEALAELEEERKGLVGEIETAEKELAVMEKAAP